MKRLRHPVRAIREPFGTAGLVVACVALIAALGGTALAAAKLNSTQKKEVEKIAKKFAGKPGAPGAPGQAGPQGPAGANGKDGAQGEKGEKGAKGDTGSPGSPGSPGTPGADGKSVEVTQIDTGQTECEGRGGALVFVEEGGSEEVCNGQEGPEGSPWTATGTLPAKATETGAWAFTGDTSDVQGIRVPLSFPIQMPRSIPSIVDETHHELFVHFETDPEFETFCHGTASLPKAEPGELCVYVNSGEPVTGTELNAIDPLSGPIAILSENQSADARTASRTGAVLLFTPPDEEVNEGFAAGSGTFAVTGCNKVIEGEPLPPTPCPY